MYGVREVMEQCSGATMMSHISLRPVSRSDFERAFAALAPPISSHGAQGSKPALLGCSCHGWGVCHTSAGPLHRCKTTT